MRVYETWHERTATTGYDLSRGVPIDRNGVFRNLFDGIAADKNIHTHAQRLSLAVEDTNVLEQCKRGWLSGVRGLYKTKHSSKGKSPAKHRILQERPYCAELI